MRVLAKISENLSQPATTLEITPEARSAPAMLSVNKVQGIPAFINATIVHLKMLQLYILRCYNRTLTNARILNAV